MYWNVHTKYEIRNLNYGKSVILKINIKAETQYYVIIKARDSFRHIIIEAEKQFWHIII